MIDLARSDQKIGVDRFRSLGQLGFGGAALGNLFEQVSDRNAEAAVATALESGIRYFDTAPLYGYGLSEERLGALLPGGVAISTKVGRLVERGGAAAGRDGFAVAGRAWFDYSRDGVRRSVEASLNRLRRDRVDILLLHDVGVLTHGDRHPAMFAQALDEALPVLADLKAAGVCDAIGIGVNEQAVGLEILAHMPLDVILLAGRYTLLEQAGATLLQEAAAQGVAIIAGGPYNSGLLARADRPGDAYDYAAPPASVEARAAAIYAIAARHHVDVGAAALAFPDAHPAIVSTIAGFRSADEVATALRRLRAPIPAAFWNELVSGGLLDPEMPRP